MNAPGSALSVERLVVSMGAQQILHEVSVTVPERGIVTVLGANGVGKTTLMRTISGVYRASSGRVVFHGQDITAQASHRIVALGLAQQAGSLSGGEQQMLCIGRALMSRPRLLLLDEPSLGLAPKIVRQIFELVTSIRAAGTAILLVEQNVRQALKVADYGYVMEGGRIVLEGPGAELRDDARVRDAYLGGA